MRFRISLYCALLLSIFFSHELKAQFSRSGYQNCFCIPPFFISQPASPAQVCPNSATVIFSVSAIGTGPLTFKWMENGVLISEGGIYSGTGTSTLTLTHPPSGLNGKVYQCRVTNCSGISVLTDPNDVLVIQANATDIDQDGITNNQDFSMLNLLYNNGCVNCREDINTDGTIDVKDFLQLLGAFNTTCQ